MLKKVKKIFNNKKLLVTSIGVSLTTSSLFAGGDIEGKFGNIDKNTNIIDTVLTNSPIVSATVQTGIIFGMLYAIFLIAKDLLTDGGGQGKGPWGKLGAIVALGILYYFLFMNVS